MFSDTVVRFHFINLASQNPDHQQIYYNYMHRIYLTPLKLYLIKVVSDASCTLFLLKTPDTFLHMGMSAWCPVLAGCCLQSDSIYFIPVLILNIISSLQVSKHQKCIVLSGLTAAKRCWRPPNTLTIRQWVLSFLDVIMIKTI